MQQSRLLLAAGLYPPDIGGPATYAAMIERELPKEGIAVTVVPYRSVRSVPKVFRHVAYALKLWKAAGAADCIYALDPVSVGVPAALVAFLRRRPLLLRLGGDYAWEQGRIRFGVAVSLDAYTAARHEAPWQVRFLHAVQAIVAKRAERVIVPSEYLASIVRTWGVSSERISVVYSALTPLPVTKTKEAARESLHVSGFVIASVARLTPWKGEYALISVLKNLHEQGLQATLLIGGDGPYRQTLEAHMKDCGMEAHARFLGVLDKTTLGELFSAADVYVLNSAYEGLSHQLLEAMAHGIPVIASNVGGNPELIRNDENGLLVTYNDEEALASALASLARDPARGARFASAAKASLAKFTEAATLKQLLTVITPYVRR
jgi:glycosyltransferase involved in cell wall biosynthesis